MVNMYLNQLSAWLTKNKLQLNSDKTKYIIFAPINKPTNSGVDIIFRGVKLKQEKQQKFLGVWFQENLSWNVHIDSLAIDLSRSVGCLHRLGSLIPIWLKLSLYYSLFYSKLCYCILVWGVTTNTNYSRLIKLQNRVLRIFERYTGRPEHLPTTPLYIKYSLLKANQIYYFRLLQYIYKNKLYVTENVPETSPYGFRRKQFKLPRTRTNYGRQHLEYQIPFLLNMVGTQLDFKKKISNERFKSLIIESNIQCT